MTLNKRRWPDGYDEFSPLNYETRRRGTGEENISCQELELGRTGSTVLIPVPLHESAHPALPRQNLADRHENAVHAASRQVKLPTSRDELQNISVRLDWPSSCCPGVEFKHFSHDPSRLHCEVQNTPPPLEGAPLII